MAMTFCSKCGKRQTDFVQFFAWQDQVVCEACAASLSKTTLTPVKQLDSTEGRRLYSVNAIVLASFWGLPLAGGIVMAINYRRLKRSKASNRTLLWSSVATIAFVYAVSLLPENLPRVALTLPPMIAMYFVADRVQGEVIAEHERNGGKLSSTWWAAGIGVACGVTLTIVGVVVLLVGGF